MSLATASLLAQTGGRGNRRTGNGPPPRPDQVQPGEPMMGGMNGRPEMMQLRTRKLENKSLDDKEQKKYELLTGSAEKRAAAASKSGRTAPAADVTNAFQLGTKQLGFGQEQDAEESFKKAWEAVPPLLKDAKASTAALGQIRTHLRALQTLAPKDAELVLTLMTGLKEEHAKAYEAIENPRLKSQLAQPLASMWFMLMQLGQLAPEDLEEGAKWVIQFPQMAAVDRPMSEEERNVYQQEMAQAQVQANQRVRQIIQRQLGRNTRQPGGPNPSNEADSSDPVVEDAMASMDLKLTAMTRFMEAEAQFRHGQFRLGMIASSEGWKELLSCYRARPTNISPIDTDIHFEAFKRINTANPVQGLIVLDQLDEAYRAMTQFDRTFASKIADEWVPMVNKLPLSFAMLSRAQFWIDLAVKLDPAALSKYASVRKELETKLDEAREAEDIPDKSGKGKDKAEKDRPDRKQPEAGENSTKDQKQEPVQERRGIKIPRAIDSTRQ